MANGFLLRVSKDIKDPRAVPALGAGRAMSGGDARGQALLSEKATYKSTMGCGSDANGLIHI